MTRDIAHDWKDVLDSFLSVFKLIKKFSNSLNSLIQTVLHGGIRHKIIFFGAVIGDDTRLGACEYSKSECSSKQKVAEPDKNKGTPTTRSWKFIHCFFYTCSTHFESLNTTESS